MSNVDAARAALLSWLPADCPMRGGSHTHNGRCPAEAHVALDALIAAVRAEAQEEWDHIAIEHSDAVSDAEAKLAALREAARYIVQLGNQSGMDDDEWEQAMTALEDALLGHRGARLGGVPPIATLDLATLAYVRASIEGIEHVGGTVNARGLIDSIIATRAELRGEAPESPSALAATPAEVHVHDYGAAQIPCSQEHATSAEEERT